VSTGSDVDTSPPTEELVRPKSTGAVTVAHGRNGDGAPGDAGIRSFAEPPGPVVPRPRRLPNPIRPSDFGTTDVVVLVAAALSALSLVWVVFYQLTLLSGGFGFLVCWYAVFLALVWFATSQLVERQAATDRVVAVVVVSAALALVGIVVFIVLWVAVKAIPTIHWGSLFSKDQKNFQPAEPDALAHVGVLHAVIGSLEQVLLATLLGVPLAVATAVFLNEVRGRGVRLVRTVVTAMSGTPSIVAGIFIYSMLILTHVLPYSGFAASLALVVILLPSVTRVVEEVLRIVPGGLREASLALGAPQWRTVWSVVLPTARSGVVTAVLLGVARIVGETAPLLFTAFGSQVTNANPFVHDQGALPLVIWSDVRTAQPVLIDIAFQSAFVLMSIVLVLFVAARIFGRTKGKKRKRSSSVDDAFARMVVPVPMERESGS
jgi:phosphate transport system permease protein